MTFGHDSYPSWFVVVHGVVMVETPQLPGIGRQQDYAEGAFEQSATSSVALATTGVLTNGATGDVTRPCFTVLEPEAKTLSAQN